ncbi:MAG: DUF4136 domain-containing protein [Acidobacteriia bacterium]|nr:DUF4136 domain-containing protein [Terriglobia bacterium]
MTSRPKGRKSVTAIRAALLVGFILVWLSTAFTQVGTNATGPATAAPPPEEANSAELAKKLSNPVAAMISVPFQSNFDAGMGPSEDGVRYTNNFQPVIPITLNQNWNLISRSIVPFIHQSNVTGPTSQTGTGDIQQSLILSPANPRPFIWGVGSIFLIPTASDKFLGVGKLGIGPTALVLTQKRNRAANFAVYKTYQWVDIRGGTVTDQLMDQNIKRTVDEQLAQKGLTRVDKDADLYVGYQAAVNEEKSVNVWGTGPRWMGGMAQAETSTIAVGKLVIDMYDPARKQLVWRGDATKTLDPKKDPDKNYKNLQKAMAKLFKNYPPQPKK